MDREARERTATVPARAFKTLDRQEKGPKLAGTLGSWTSWLEKWQKLAGAEEQEKTCRRNFAIFVDNMEFLHFTLIDLIDIVLVAAVIYVIFRWIKGSSAMNIFIAILILFFVRVLATALNMRMISALLGAILDMGALAIIIIFQPEIRRFLNNIGQTAGNNTLVKRLLSRQTADGLESDTLQQIVSAVEQMAAHKTGALIVIRRRDNLQSVIATGDSVDARISERLIMNIFFKNSPLHDGAMVIGGNRIVAARCILPLTERLDLPASYGMRHRAAVGLAEQCDADIVVVSEETGNISFVRGREITPVETSATLKLKLQNNDQ